MENLKLINQLMSRNILPWSSLLVIVVIEAMLCVDYHERRWDIERVKNPPLPGNAGEGLVIHANGLGYYAWLRSLLVDYDWDFDNEFDEHNPHEDYVPPRSYRTPLGRRANQWSVGPACLWGLTVVPGHFVVKASGGTPTSWVADGYSLPYQLLVGGSSLLIAFLGLGFVYGLCRTQARPARGALATMLLTLGTTIVYYNAIEISLPHDMGTALLGGFVWYWLTSYGSLRGRRWFFLGIWLGTAALVRWQLASFIILPIGETLLTWRHRALSESGYSWRRSVMLATFACFGAVVAFLPQLLAWLMERASGWQFRLLTGVGFTLVFYNLLLVLQYAYGRIPQDEGLGPHALLTSTWQFIRSEFATCILLGEVLGLLWLLLVWGPRTPREHFAGQQF